ncbi:MAG: hypothetical protein ACKOC1_01075 [Hyphomicrobiales bacterium]
MTNHSLNFERFPHVTGKLGSTRSSAPTGSKGLQWPNFYRFLAGFLVVFAIGMMLWPNLPRRFEASASLILRPTNEAGQYDPALSLRQALDDGAVQSEIDAISSVAIIENVVKNMKLSDDPEFNPENALLKSKVIDPIASLFSRSALATTPPSYSDVVRQVKDRLDVSRDRRSYTISLAFTAADPAKAAMIANALTDAYLAHRLARKRDGLEGLSSSLKRQLVELTTRQEIVQLDLQGLVNTPENRLSADSVSLVRLLDSLGLERARLIARRAEIAATLERPIASAGSVSTLPETTARQRVLLSEDDRLSSQMRSLDDEIERLNAESRQRALIELQANPLRRELESLSGQISALRARLISQYLVGDAPTPDVEIIARAVVPVRASFPNPLMTGLALLLASLLAGCVMIWPTLAAFFQSKIRTR